MCKDDDLDVGMCKLFDLIAEPGKIPLVRLVSLSPRLTLISLSAGMSENRLQPKMIVFVRGSLKDLRLSSTNSPSELFVHTSCSKARRISRVLG